MKKQVDEYNFGRISSRMAKKFGTIEKNQENKYINILFPIESNLLKTNRKHGINNGRRVIEAIHIFLLMIDGYFNQIEYDLDPYISDTNNQFLNALIMSIDPITNEHLRPFVEEVYDIDSTEGLHEYFELPVKALLRIEKSIELWTKTHGHNGYFSYLESQIGNVVAHDDLLNSVVVSYQDTNEA